ncbi:MAG: DsbA family protein [Alistipes sp.]|nr:DsbA family protein [Alistipes sp.]
MERIRIYQFTDPTCIWCWGNEPAIRALDYLYGSKIDIEFIMGGLVEDIYTLYNIEGSRQHILDCANARITDTWRAASKCHAMPIREGAVALYNENYTSSFPQNIAYEAAKRIDRQKAKHFLRLLREATFTEGKRTSQIDVLIELAAKAGIDATQFIDAYTNGDAQADFLSDRMLCQRNGITGFPSYMIKYNDTSIILGGYQNLDTFHNIIARLSGGKVKPKKAGPSLANVREFINHYERVYPVEIETAFGLDKAATDLMISNLIEDGSVATTPIGQGQRLSLSGAYRTAQHNKKFNYKTMEKKELKTTATKAENAATKSAAEKSATKASAEKCTTKGCGTSKPKATTAKKEKQTVKA